ncbi:uncharacterized protein I206_105260 [Kwoniella pini CBS 10737]|uniref:WSC domain-containing protein n=1 Tax=Kwoniella pini CBS 10737 TaxID=1296096 RepID=A0A1B9I4P3_9TREE|nr:uncharacterized protein I206_03831 [Kwoniella pini CBS 10737]OCF50507.1 hypothetical protein I206_03831 [Kwoniella pini CBS 10737]
MLTSFFSLSIILICFSFLKLVRSDDLFIGCGDELTFIEATFQTPHKGDCYKMCKNNLYTYYTYKQDQNECDCYIYPPPAAEYMPGGPEECNGQLQYNIVKSNWKFQKCYNSPNMTETPSDSFKACMDGCAPHEVAIARPTGDYPGQTNCICASKNQLNHMVEAVCGLDQYYAYTHTPTPVPSGKRVGRSLIIAQRQAFSPRGPYGDKKYALLFREG